MFTLLGVIGKLMAPKKVALVSALYAEIDHGGWMMWSILIMLDIVLVILVERVWMLVSTHVNKTRLLALIKSQVLAGNVQGAVKACQSNPSPLCRILQAGLASYQKTDKEVQAAMDEAALKELPKIEKRTGYLAMLGNLATLAGLLGTIMGLIKSFAGVAGVDPAMKATMLASGISEAMHCTKWGLLTGIAGLLFFAVLNGQTQYRLDTIHEVSVETMNLVTSHRQALKSAGGQS